MPDANTTPQSVMLVVPPADDGFPVEALSEQGWDVHVVSDVRRPTMVQTAIAIGRSARRRPLATWNEARSPSRRQRFMRARTIALAPPLLHVFSHDRAREWNDVARTLGASMVVTLSGDEAIAIACNDGPNPLAIGALAVDSEGVAEHLDRDGDTPVIVVPPAPDASLLQAPPASEVAGAPLRILGIGPLSWTQGYEHALAAVKLVTERGISVQYRIVGRGAYLDAIAFARHELGLEEFVELVEPSSRAELHAHFRWAGVLLDASVAATSPKPVLDANAAGVPVVSTDPEHPDRAIVVPRRDPRALCDALARLAGDIALRARLIEAGRSHALSAPTAAMQAARYGDLYKAALGRRHGSFA